MNIIDSSNMERTIKNLRIGDKFRFEFDSENIERILESRGLFEATVRTIDKKNKKEEVLAVNRFDEKLKVNIIKEK